MCTPFEWLGSDSVDGDVSIRILRLQARIIALSQTLTAPRHFIKVSRPYNPDLDIEVLATGFGRDGSAEGRVCAVRPRDDALVFQPVRDRLDQALCMHDDGT